MGTSSGVYDLIYKGDKTRVHMFYFDSNTTAPLRCDALVVRKAHVDTMSSG